MAGISSVSGLVSGLDTATIIEQLIAVSRKRIDVVASNQTTFDNKLTAYQSLNTQLSSFKSKADILRDADTFNVFKNVTTTDSVAFLASDLLSVSTTTDAAPGTHTIRFTSSSQLAQARKLSSQSYSDASTALGISGEFVINGKAISVTTTDSLNDIASSINNANSGTNATGVTASVLSISSTDNRLILTSGNTGKDEFSILDASTETTEDILQALGLTTAQANETIKNTTSDGAESDKLSSSSTAVGNLLGLTSAQSGTVTIGSYTRTIDLSTDSLSAIAGTINGMTNITATVESTTTDGVTTYYIDISGTTTFSDNNNVLETLGILEGVNGSEQEVHTASVANTQVSGAGGGPIVTGTQFDEINTGGDSSNVTVDDTITISGTDHDGNAVSGSYTISNLNNQISALLTQIETVLEQNGGSNSFTASLSGGQIVVTDDQAGDSQMSVNIITNNEGGGTLDFGTVTATTEGYDMQVTAGQDANVEIDGVAITQSSNLIDDVISGVTIDLTRAETDNTTVNLTISRDTDSIKSSVNNFITEYNSIIEFINQQFTYDEDTESSGELAGESVLYTIKSTIQSTITNTNSLLSGNYDALSLIGINSDTKGKLSLDSTDFLSAINTDFNAVKRLFTAEGTTTDSEITYISHTKDTVQGDYAVVINTVATQATVTGTSDLSSGIGAGNTETITITDTLTSRVATINLDGDTTTGDSLVNIVNTINSELAAEYTEILVGDNGQTAGGPAITSSTTFDAIDGETLMSQTDEIISISGTTRSGISVSNTFTISDKTTDTIQDFLSFIEDTYNNEVSATIDTSGTIVLTENTVGDSLLTISIDEPAGKGVDFGNVSTSNSSAATTGQDGRYAMEITASASGNNLAITHDTYGSNYGFTIAEINDYSGITDGTYAGVDVAGTINGEASTGSGQILTGDAPGDGETTSVERLSIKVTSTTTGAKGNVKLTIGVAEEMYRELDFFTDQYDGLLTIRMDGLQDTIDDIQDTINDMEVRLVLEQLRLENQFVQLELSLSKLQSMSAFLSQQLSSLSRS
jgi:flagellar hook-associated protein 2